MDYCSIFFFPIHDIWHLLFISWHLTWRRILQVWFVLANGALRRGLLALLQQNIHNLWMFSAWNWIVIWISPIVSSSVTFPPTKTVSILLFISMNMFNFYLFWKHLKRNAQMLKMRSKMCSGFWFLGISWTWNTRITAKLIIWRWN